MFSLFMPSDSFLTDFHRTAVGQPVTNGATPGPDNSPMIALRASRVKINSPLTVRDSPLARSPIQGSAWIQGINELDNRFLPGVQERITLRSSAKEVSAVRALSIRVSIMPPISSAHQLCSSLQSFVCAMRAIADGVFTGSSFNAVSFPSTTIKVCAKLFVSAAAFQAMILETKHWAYAL